MSIEARGIQRVALIGYGEVGRILAEDLRVRGLLVSAHDLQQGSQAAMAAHARAQGVALAGSHAEACAGAELVICAVTASQTEAAATMAAPGLCADSFFLDFNSASPATKQRCAALVHGAGGRYVEGAVMTSVPPCRSAVPLLLGGPHAQALEPLLQALGFAPRVASEQLGVASATKMCRSVVIKGMEALLVESLTAARHFGVEDAVLASLQETFPGMQWEKQASYFFQRVIEHGQRRAEEMQEAARTVAEAGLEPLSASSTASRQAFMAQLASAGVFGARASAAFARSSDWRAEADRLLARTSPGKAGS
jgi:3-hydroxyisobutyrate dehydrogenase-like beta-hydroxyacid dehydrogenase